MHRAPWYLIGLVLALLVAGPIRAVDPQVRSFTLTKVEAPPLSATGYGKVLVNNTDGSVEHRCYFRSQHFLSVLSDPAGAFAIRLHPGVDVNGWGTTVYLHPHLSGVALTGAVIDDVTPQAGHVIVNASGPLKNASGTQKGAWSVSLQFTFDPALRKVAGNGALSISRTQSLPVGTDLDVVKIASNFLQEVPLLTGGTGNTGDTTGAEISGSALPLETWDPAVQAGHFPQDHCDWLDITLPGAYNLVDTARQPDVAHPGQYLEPIAAAYKPSTRVRFDLLQSGLDIPFIFGALFDTARATDFKADNIGVTPQIRSFEARSQYDLQLTIESLALPEDANKPDSTLVVQHGSSQSVMDAMYSTTLLPDSWQRVGSLKRRGDGTFSATLKIPDGPRGFIRGQITE